ncbi:MCM2/3/5 family protein [Dictyocaulus viviparus]|uniref:DNA replication licensing factor MCM5 n=1 Tax=Dictyocaulus viviparus TaxID=29172 RepID=A0A0D8XI96_DICVI|nr:MCM2/3/5 family protein [Dictyocaulus viviparus]
MSNFDDAGLYYQVSILFVMECDHSLNSYLLKERFFANDGLPDAGREVIAEYRQICEQFRRFIREFSTGGARGLHYRDELKKNYNAKHYFLEVSLTHLKQFDEDAESKLRTYPAKFLPAFEEAARTVADELTAPRSEADEEMQDIQACFAFCSLDLTEYFLISLTLDEYPTSIRKVKSAQVSQIVKISGIIVAASQVRAKATKITLQCRTCLHTISDQVLKPGLEGFQLPRTCGAPQYGQQQRCPLDPYHIVPDKCQCVDYQTLKLQENPEDVPHGEMPRHLQLYCDRYLTDKVAPGNRVTLVGVFSIKKLAQKSKSNKDRTFTGIRIPYLRVLGIKVEAGGLGRAEVKQFTPEDERKFKELSARPDVYELISKSIAPSIYGFTDVKKSIACLLFGGSRKRLPDGLTRRGDINVLLLGDPGTAKSQLLKFVEQVAPISVYTSGKGSSAAGLTASVIRDPVSRAFMMEGGAMVLADGGVVCIDEFDKMREDDRVAIHEAMEQQTISIAKAGITTTLNSRCSVLAAANSVYGRWDDSRGDENIDFMPTILSRFDMIYIVRDTHDVKRDETLAKHVIDVHVNASLANEKSIEKDVNVAEKMEMFDADGFLTLGKLTKQASEKLANSYVRMRNPPLDIDEIKLGKKAHKSSISITVRQLEAVVRISESLAKLELQPFALDKHVDEALRLFRVSTVEAAATGSLAGVEGFTSDVDQESMNRIETQMKKRFSVGTHVSELVIIQDFVTRQGYNESLVKKVIMNLVRRGDLQYKMQRKMLFRVR